LKYKLKTYAEDFVVDEILADGSTASRPNVSTELQGPFVWVALKKVNWNTIDLAREIGKRLRISERRVNYGGIKDRKAVAYQVFSVNTRASEQEVMETIARIKDVEVIAAWRRKGWIKSEDIVGNRFEIILRECDFYAQDVLANHPTQFPNYFGEQRFGSMRHNSARVGQYVLKGDYKAALDEYFVEEAIVGGREKLMFEKSKRIEPKRFIQMNWRLFKLCVHAFQSQLFNEELEARIMDNEMGVLEGEYSCGRNAYGFADITVEGNEFVVAPLMGSGLKLQVNKYKAEQLNKYELTMADFEMLNIKGGWRTLYAPVVGLDAKDLSDGCVQVSFAIQKGSYATVALDHILQKE